MRSGYSLNRHMRAAGKRHAVLHLSVCFPKVFGQCNLVIEVTLTGRLAIPAEALNCVKAVLRTTFADHFSGRTKSCNRDGISGPV